MLGLFLAFVCILGSTPPALGLENGLALTPAMGYNTWNDYLCDVDADDIMQAADTIIALGLNKIGYEYVNLDDCWAIGRDENGKIIVDPERFPDGMKAVADYVHSLGLKFGIYTDRGNYTCQKRPGSLNHEVIDAQTYAEWEVDYLKEDSCFATQVPAEAFLEYGTMRDALNATGRSIYFSLCGWFPYYAPVGASLGNSWRISQDCKSWESVLLAIDTNVGLAKYAGPGSWNDPDMLIGSSPLTAFSLTEIQSRSMFSMWSVMAAPLLIGSNIRNLSNWDLTTYTNSEVIAVDQDSLGIQGTRIQGSNLFSPIPQTNIWARPLSFPTNSSVAAVFINNHNKPQTITCDEDCFAAMGITSSVKVRDLWTHTNNGTTPNTDYSIEVPGEGASVMVRFDPL